MNNISLQLQIQQVYRSFEFRGRISIDGQPLAHNNHPVVFSPVLLANLQLFYGHIPMLKTGEVLKHNTTRIEEPWQVTLVENYVKLTIPHYAAQYLGLHPQKGKGVVFTFDKTRWEEVTSAFETLFINKVAQFSQKGEVIAYGGGEVLSPSNIRETIAESMNALILLDEKYQSTSEDCSASYTSKAFLGKAAYRTYSL